MGRGSGGGSGAGGGRGGKKKRSWDDDAGLLMRLKLNENAWSSGIIHVHDSRYQIYCCMACGTCIQVCFSRASRMEAVCRWQ